MSSFGCNVVRIDSVDHHPNADRLSIVRIGGYNCISAKMEDGSHRYSAGDLVVYIPEAAVLPEWLLKFMNFWKDGKGMLSGSRGDRVKAIKLRDVVSQGVLFPVTNGNIEAMGTDGVMHTHPVTIGDDLSAILGIVKYEPPIPVNMAGEVLNLFGKTVKFDVENLQKYPDIFQEGEPVVATEKLHGTFVAMCYWPDLNNPEVFEGDCFAYSKGLGSQGLVFKHNERNAGNLYQRQLVEGGVAEKIKEHFAKVWAAQRMNAYSCRKSWPVTVMGEIFGRGVQDLQYGQTTPTFRVFDVFVGEPSKGFWLNWEELNDWCSQVDLDIVPVLYEGPYNYEKLVAIRDGQDTISGSNIREGCVVKSATNRTCDEIGRVMLKMVSPNYLLRKGDATEYQ